VTNNVGLFIIYYMYYINCRESGS